MKNANGVIKKLTSAERSYYTAAEVREMMGVSRDTAYRMTQKLCRPQSAKRCLWIKNIVRKVEQEHE